MRQFWAARATLPLLLLLLTSAPLSSAQNCIEFFSGLDGAVEFGPSVSYQHPTPTSELEPEDTLLLNFTWTENSLYDPTITEIDSDDEYIDVLLGNSSADVYIVASIKGLCDYSSDWTSSPKEKLSLVLVYRLITPVPEGNTCTLTLEFKLQDENTAYPTANSDQYTLTVREDFPLDLTLPYLEVVTKDTDGTAPNNLMTATVDADCPLEADEDAYDGKGQDVSITFHLREELDYDTMDDPVINCQVTITDEGTDPLSREVTIALTVQGFEDEPPIFESPIYTSTLDSQEASGDPLLTDPAPILANDSDKDGSAILYTMEPYERTEWNDYFTIDTDTAAVTVVQSIPDDLLGDYSIHFIVTATDGNSNEDTTILEIFLPTAATTSMTSTSTTFTSTTQDTTSLTTVPSTILTTIPSTTTDTTPVTTPCTTPSIPTTFSPTLETCPPCPTTFTMSTDTTAHTSTPTSTSTTTTTTTSPTTTAPTTTPEPVTESCPPCEKTTVITTCPTQPTTEGTTVTTSSLSTIISSSEGIVSTAEIITTSTESGVTIPTCQTCDPCECVSPSTFEPDATTTTPGVTNPGATTVTSTVTNTLPTTTTTPAAATSCPTVPTVPTASPPAYEYEFERASYNYMVYTTSTKVGILRVVQADGSGPEPEDVHYEWDESSGEGTEYFLLDSTTGVITTQDPLVGSYEFTATAVVGGDQQNKLFATVYIGVLEPPKCDGVMLQQGVVPITMSENTTAGTEITTLNTVDGNQTGFCITAVQPEDYFGNFIIYANGTLTLGQGIDADEMPVGERYIAVRVKASEGEEPCISAEGDIARNEAIVMIAVTDVNDLAPTLVSPSTDTLVGYPLNEALQRVAGPIVTVKAEDNDTVGGGLVYSLSGKDSDLFLLDEATGNLFLADPTSCSESCQVVITVSDQNNEDAHSTVTVVPLNTEDIYDISFDDMTSTEIEKQLQELSMETGIDLHLLYTSYALREADDENVDRDVGRIKASGRRTKRASSDLGASSWVSVAHIYGFDENRNFVSLDELNSALTNGTQASAFSEAETFNPPPAEAADVTGYQVAVGILGGLLGIVLIAGLVGGFLWHRRKKKRTQRESSSLQTLGSAYPNHAFNTEMSEIDRGKGSSTSSGSTSRRVSAISPTAAAVTAYTAATTVGNHYKDPVDDTSYHRPDEHQPSAPEVLYEAPVRAAADPQRKSSHHSLGGLARIDPGPSPDGTRSSPYLTGAEGGFQASRPSEDETVASFTAYKGGSKKLGDSPEPLRVNAAYSPVYKKSPYVSFGGASEIQDGDSRSRTEGGDGDKNDLKKSNSGYGVSVRTKKEPPDLSATAPAKPIMKQKAVTAEVHREPETPAPSGSFSNLQGSPTMKKKKKVKSSNSAEEDAHKNMDAAAESSTSDSETKKSVAFKVLVDQKEIERINH